MYIQKKNNHDFYALENWFRTHSLEVYASMTMMGSIVEKKLSGEKLSPIEKSFSANVFIFDSSVKEIEKSSMFSSIIIYNW